MASQRPVSGGEALGRCMVGSVETATTSITGWWVLDRHEIVVSIDLTTRQAGQEASHVLLPVSNPILIPPEDTPSPPSLPTPTLNPPRHPQPQPLGPPRPTRRSSSRDKHDS